MFNWFFDMVAAHTDAGTARRLAYYERRVALQKARMHLRTACKIARNVQENNLPEERKIRVIA